MKKILSNVEIISSTSGQSGLKLTNLPSGTANTAYNGILGLAANGDVIKIDASTIATVTVSNTAPTSPVVGQQWLDTSVSPSELKVYNGTAWELAGDEVQHYPNFASFPATGNENILYVDDSADIVYVWDSTTSAYVNASGTGAGLFSITDGTNTQSVGVGNTISFLDSNLVKAVVSATDTVTIGIDTTGATNGQVAGFDGTNVVWTTPLSTNIYTADGTLTDDRIVTIPFDKSLKFVNDQNPGNAISVVRGPNDEETFVINNGLDTITIGNDTSIKFDFSTGEQTIYQNGSINSNTDFSIISATGNYFLGTGVSGGLPNNNTLNKILVRDASDGKVYTRDMSSLVVSANRFATTITPVANTQQVVTHSLNNSDVIVQVRDAVSNEVVSVEIEILSANTVGITSTTTDTLRIVCV